MRRSVLVLGLATLTLALTAPAAHAERSRSKNVDVGSRPTRPPKPARGKCAVLGGNAATEAIADNVFAGSISDLLVDGVHRPAWVTQTLTDVRISTDGAVKATATTVYELDGNNDGACAELEACFETTDRVRISGLDLGGDDEIDGQKDAGPDEENPELRNIQVQSNVAGGTGEFATACGKLTLHGTVDFSAEPTSSSWRLRGRVCDCE